MHAHRYMYTPIEDNIDMVCSYVRMLRLKHACMSCSEELISMHAVLM